MICLTAVAIVGAAHAQEAAPVAAGEVPAGAEKLVPKEPLVPPLGGRAEYKVKYFYEFGADWERSPKWQTPARDRSQVIDEVTISTDAASQTARVQTRWSDGKVYNEWFYKGTQAAPRTNDKGYYVLGTGAAGPASGFPELSWVSMKNFKGAAKFGEALVFVFRQSIGDEQKKPKSEDVNEEGIADERQPVYRTGERVAYLDAKTQMPILSNDGQVIRVYRIVTPAPTDKLNPPAELIEMLQKRQAAIQDRVALPGDPAG